MTKRSRGLAPFDQPLYFDAELSDETDLAGRREGRHPLTGLLGRTIALTGVATVLPFLTTDEVAVPAVLGVAVHLPLTTAVDARRSRPAVPSTLRDLVVVVLDVAMLVLVAALAGRLALLVLLGALTAAFHRWLHGRRAGVLSVLSIGAVAAVLVATEAVPGDWFDVVAVVFAGVLLVALVDDQASRQTRTTHGLQLVAGRAEAVLSGIGESIVTTDVRGRVRSLNPAAARLIGRDPASVRVRGCDEVLALRADGRALSCDGGCALLRATATPVELWRTGPHGDRQPLLAEAVPLYGPDGDVVEIVHSFRDITNLKAADEAKTMFLATASHELKTPLVVINGFARLLRGELAPEVHQRAVESIEQRSNELASIVDRLLMSSRIEFGAIDLDPSLIDVTTILEARLREFGEASDRQVQVDLEPDLPLVWAEANAVVTVIDHLLENAAKYSPDGGGIRARIGRADGGVFVEVSDQGIGMTEEQREHCFDRFWQASRGDGRRFGGTGIGLYIVRSLVEAMDGAITVASAPGEGTTFRFVLRSGAPEQPPETSPAPVDEAGEPSMIREFMRQVGVLDPTGPQP